MAASRLPLSVEQLLELQFLDYKVPCHQTSYPENLMTQNSIFEDPVSFQKRSTIAH